LTSSATKPLTAAGLQAAIDNGSEYEIVGSLKARLGETLL
jgi:hypothetical protein